MQQFEIEGVGIVTITKSARAKRLILKITPDGEPRVTMPQHMPYAVGQRFAKRHSAWFIKNLPRQPKLILENGKRIGQTHRLELVAANVTKPASRVQNKVIHVSYPPVLKSTDELVQAVARAAAIRALKKEGDEYLPSWFHSLAYEHGYTYKGVSVKKMKSRWGSCSGAGHIALSIWLMQLPDDLIEYVLCHELTHLVHKHHQTDFWLELSSMIPDYKERRKQLHSYQPTLL